MLTVRLGPIRAEGKIELCLPRNDPTGVGVGRDGFRNWNLEQPMFSSSSISLPPLSIAEKSRLRQQLEQAINQTCILRVCPGMRGDFLIALMNSGVQLSISPITLPPMNYGGKELFPWDS